MSRLRSLAISTSISVLTIGAGIARAQDASTTDRQALSAFPCPSGDSKLRKWRLTRFQKNRRSENIANTMIVPS